MNEPLRHRLHFEVHLRSPFVMAAVEAAGIGIDTPAMRDEVGRPIIPADHFKGLLREAFRALSEAMRPARFPPSGLSEIAIFGPEFAGADTDGVGTSASSATPYAPERGRLIFGDLAATTMILPDAKAARPEISEWRKETAFQDLKGARQITRIAINKESGTAEPGMLQVVELAAPLGAIAVFEGDALFHGSKAEADELAGALSKALKIIPFFGGLRSAGFGEHVASGSSARHASSEAIIAQAPNLLPGSQFTVECAFDRPYLDPVFTLRLRLRREPGAGTKRHLEMLLKDIERNGLSLGHGGNRGFGWFKVEREA